MEESSDNLKDPYYEIHTINNYFWEDNNGNLKVNPKCKSIHNYCYYGDTPGKDKCNNYLEMTNCSVIYLLKTLKETYKLKDDKIAEYAILWLNYNLNINPNNNFTNLNEFYTKYIVNNKCYDDKIKDKMTYKNIIDANKDLTNMNIKEISKFSGPFSILFYLYYAYYHYYWDCDRNLGYANSFVSEFKNLNDDPNNIENSSYNKLLSTLSNDYNNLKNIFYDKNASCKFPSLPKIEPKENSVGNSGKGSGQIMGQSSYSIEDVCEAINKIDAFTSVSVKDTLVLINNNDILKEFCTTNKGEEDEGCVSITQMIYSAIITLLKHFKNVVDDDEDGLENDKLAQYAILWLNYKLDLMSYKNISNLNVFHNKYIKDIEKTTDAEAYNIYMDLINKKGNLVNMDIKIMSKFYELLKILCKLYNEFDDENPDCTVCSKNPNEFDIYFKTLNNDSSITGNETYSQLLDTLSNDYGNLKNKCKCSLSLPTREQMQPTPQGSEATSSGSSVASKLIPALLVFAIPFFLGIAYKYSLFGFGKRSQKQYLKKRLKK
ncbi:CIR protein [Plasmodium chabaudi adami]|uniref:CIR protein n=1 Tax=Plasmodium chabaudi adami TaxID=5826 RepID=A0A1D3L7H4_PLACE|nr:CIR protein [Plasmodium chabaudi adami]